MHASVRAVAAERTTHSAVCPASSYSSSPSSPWLLPRATSARHSMSPGCGGVEGVVGGWDRLAASALRVGVVGRCGCVVPCAGEACTEVTQTIRGNKSIRLRRGCCCETGRRRKTHTRALRHTKAAAARVCGAGVVRDSPAPRHPSTQLQPRLVARIRASSITQEASSPSRTLSCSLNRPDCLRNTEHILPASIAAQLASALDL